MASYSNHTDRRPGPVPPRWLNCPRKSLSLVGPKFLALKAPLSNRFDDQVPPQNRFTPSMLFESMKSYKVKIGLWVDLTNTNRFYDKAEVEKEGARYLKLQCRGFGECPSKEQVNTFVEICDRFIRMNPLEIIAVHCTHGFNRSGFMISSYYITKEDWSCDLAVSTFAKARPPGIYKKDYLLELYERYDDPDAAPNPPELPDWCLGENDGDDDGDVKSEASDRKRRKFSRIKNAEFMEGVPGVQQVTDEQKLKYVQKKIQVMCNWKQNGFPGCQPVSMTQENLKLLERHYKVSWKADGTRYMMFIDGKSQIYFADRDHCIFLASDVDFRDKRNLHNHLCDTLLDGEMVLDKDPRTGEKYPRYLIYDAIRIHGRDISNDNFQLRLDRIYTDIIGPRNAAIEHGLINKSKQTFSVRRKDFWDATTANTSKLLSDNFKSQLLHDPDGLIFQPVEERYISGRCDSVLKWKPASLNSVDFRVKIVTIKEIGCPVVTRADLYVGGMAEPFGSMKATREIKELNGKIIECKLENMEDPKKQKWVLMRERTDKSFPNGYNTAMGVCNSILNPVTEEVLLSFLDSHGYTKPDRELMPPPANIPKIK